MIKRTLKKTNVQPKKDFLNPAQRKELKKMLIEKFTKVYGLSNPIVVRDMVERFFKSTKNVNAKEILKLENQIKKESLNHKSITTKAKPVNKERESKTQEMQSPPQFEEFEESQNMCANQTIKRMVKNDIDDDLSEEDENWDTIGMYQAYIAK